jgi:cell division septation protein DedD
VSLVLLAVVVPGLVGNAVLHAHTRKRVVKAVADAPSLGDACVALAKDASSWQGLKGVMLVTGLLAAAVVVALLSSGPKIPRAPTPANVAPAARSSSPAAKVRLPSPEDAAAPVGTSPSPVSPPASEASTALEPAPSAPSPAPAVESAPVEPVLPILAPVGDSEKPRKQNQSRQQDKAVPPAEVKPAVKASVKATAPASTPTAATAYAINVGVFADQTNAERALTQLKAAQLPAYAQRIEAAKGPLTRVRVGPFADADEADAAARRIRALGLEALVYRP